MILNFSVKNYLSFKERNTISFEASSVRDSLLSNTYQTDSDLRVLKAITLFGPNGSGKSNLIKALSFAINFIQNSANENLSDRPIVVTYFKFSTERIGQPSFFEIELIAEDNHRYLYTFSVDTKNVQYERLKLIVKTRDYLLFERTPQGIHVDENRFSEGLSVERKTRHNTLFLSAAANWNGRISLSILAVLNKVMFINDMPSMERETAQMLEQEKYKPEILDFLKTSGLAFKDIVSTRQNILPELFEGLPEEIKASYPRENFLVQTIYDVFDEFENIVRQDKLHINSEESAGTRKMIRLAGPFIDAVLNGKILVIDEFTARLHPKLAEHIIKYFYKRTINPLITPQLILASHNVQLMNSSLFRRDQIYLSYRDEFYASSLFTILSQKTNVRHDANYVKKYLEGALGALPDIIDPT